MLLRTRTGKGVSANGNSERDATRAFTALVQVAVMAITGERKEQPRPKGDLSRRQSEKFLLLWTGRGKASSLSALPSCLFTAGDNRGESKGFTIMHMIYTSFRWSEVALSIKANSAR